MAVHGLAGSAPQAIYISHGQRPHKRNELAHQPSIDAAFKTKPRISSNVVNLDATDICTVNGMHTGRLGVISTITTLYQGQAATARVAVLEPTLIDIVVRPSYARGEDMVMSAFRYARARIDTGLQLDTLGRLAYVYPYR